MTYVTQIKTSDLCVFIRNFSKFANIKKLKNVTVEIVKNYPKYGFLTKYDLRLENKKIYLETGSKL